MLGTKYSATLLPSSNCVEHELLTITRARFPEHRAFQIRDPPKQVTVLVESLPVELWTAMIETALRCRVPPRPPAAEGKVGTDAASIAWETNILRAKWILEVCRVLREFRLVCSTFYAICQDLVQKYIRTKFDVEQIFESLTNGLKTTKKPNLPFFIAVPFIPWRTHLLMEFLFAHLDNQSHVPKKDRQYLLNMIAPHIDAEFCGKLLKRASTPARIETVELLSALDLFQPHVADQVVKEIARRKSDMLVEIDVKDVLTARRVVETLFRMKHESIQDPAKVLIAMETTSSLAMCDALVPYVKPTRPIALAVRKAESGYDKIVEYRQTLLKLVKRFPTARSFAMAGIVTNLTKRKRSNESVTVLRELLSFSYLSQAFGKCIMQQIACVFEFVWADPDDCDRVLCAPYPNALADASQVLTRVREVSLFLYRADGLDDLNESLMLLAQALTHNPLRLTQTANDNRANIRDHLNGLGEFCSQCEHTPRFHTYCVDSE